MCSYDELDTLLNENWIANSSARQLTFDREEIKPILKEYRLKQIYEKIFPELKQLQESLYLKPENFLTFLISMFMRMAQLTFPPFGIRWNTIFQM